MNNSLKYTQHAYFTKWALFSFSTCTEAKWKCTPVNGRDLTTTDTGSLCGENMEYNACPDPFQPSCDKPDQISAADSTKVCYPKCTCKAGYILDGDKCVKKSECPCRHGGSKYYEGNSIRVDCNQWYELFS